MPNRNTHSAYGAGAGILFVLAKQIGQHGIDLAGLLGSAAGGLLGGRLPDIIDPPDSPGHRAVGHSVSACAITAALLTMILKMPEAPADQYAAFEHSFPAELNRNQMLVRLTTGFLEGMIAGYVSHLLLDSGTPAGIKL